MNKQIAEFRKLAKLPIIESPEQSEEDTTNTYFSLDEKFNLVQTDFNGVFSGQVSNSKLAVKRLIAEGLLSEAKPITMVVKNRQLVAIGYEFVGK